MYQAGALLVGLATFAAGAQTRAAQADAASAADVRARVEQPRPFGVQLGDILTQRVLLEVDGHAFEPAALPTAERVGVWLERRMPRLVSDAEGRRWLVVDYQLINTPQFLARLHLPAWTLKSADGRTTLAIDDWTFSAAPLTPRTAFVQGGLDEMRPDLAPRSIDSAPTRRALNGFIVAFSATVVLWVAIVVWRNLRAASRQPFAIARRALRSNEADAPESWQALHRAFDATAGVAVQAATLHTLFERAPHFVPLRADIERFYAHSAARFYGGSAPGKPPALRPLCTHLRRLEKRQER